MNRLLIALGLVAGACTSAQISQTLAEANRAMEGTTAPSTLEVGQGLKEALSKGIEKGADQLSQTDGYYQNAQIRIPFPPDVKRVEDKLRQLGLGKEVDKFIVSMNRGAEEAAKGAKPIFLNAINQMTFEDAWGILKGDQDAATQYLKRTTTGELRAKFKPVIKNSLDQVSATRYYGDIINTYNKIPLVEKVNPDLSEYATDRAMQGLFIVMASEEKKIRENPVERTTDIMKKVFAYQK